MNKFTLSSLRPLLFTIFLAVTAVLLHILFFGSCYRNMISDDDALYIPEEIFLSFSDASESDLSETDISESDLIPDA